MVLAVRRAVAIAGLMAALVGSAVAQSTLVPITVTPSSLTFDISAGNPAAQVVNVSRSDQPNAIALFSIAPPSWVTVVDNATSTPVSGNAIMPIALRISVNRSLVPAGTTQGAITLAGQGLLTTGINVNLTGGGTGTIGAFTVTTSSGAGSLSFTEATASTPQTISIATNQGVIPSYTLTLTYLSGSNWLNVTPTPNTGLSNTSNPITVTANPAGLATGTTYSASLTLTPNNIVASAVTVPITLTVGGTGTRTLVASTNTVSVTPATPLGAFTVTPSLNETVPVTTTLSSNLTGFVNILTAPATLSPGANTFQVQLVNQAAVNLSGTLTITPSVGSGYAPLSIVITTSTTGGATRTLIPSPASLNLNATTPGASVTVTPSISQAVTVNAQLSAYSTLISVSPQTATIPATGTTFSLLLIGAQSIPNNTQVNLVLTPTDPTFQTLTIPISVNGGVVNPVSSIVPSPTALTVNAQLGQSQNLALSVTSADLVTPVFFNAFATTSGGGASWLSVSPLTTTTPANLTVTINGAAFTQAGTFSGNIALTPLNNVGATVNVPVTVNVGGVTAVAANPTAVALTVAAGSTTPVTSAVQLTSTSTTVPNPAFTVATTTTTGQNWLSATANTTTLPASLTVSVNPAALTQGSYTGNVAVSVTGAQTLNIPVTVTVAAGGTLSLSPASLTFGYQTGSTSAPAAQTVNVTSTGSAVTFNAAPTSTGNWLQVTPATGTTPAALSVSVIPTGLAAGTYQGTIQIASSNAVNSPQTINVTLTVTSPALPQVSSFANAASQLAAVASPGMIFTVYGADLGPATPVQGTITQGRFGTELGGTRVLFDGVAAPLLYTSPMQVSGVVPFELAGRFSTRMQLEYRGVVSREIELRVAETAPAIFTTNSRGNGQAAALNQNGSINGPVNAEIPGNIIVLYATGFGQTSPASTSGALITDARRPTSPVTVRIAGRDAEVVYVGSAPTFVAGAIQLNVRIPVLDGVTGSVPVSVLAGGVATQSDVTISVR